MSEGNPRFGEEFKIDPQNRMDVLGDQEQQPSYVRAAREIRRLLKEQIEKDGWPSMPDVKSVEDVFKGSARGVDSLWVRKVAPNLGSKFEAWADQLPESEQLGQLLRDPNQMEEIMRLRQFGVLESLRTSLPEAWRELLLISAERQMAAMELVRHWLREIPEAERDQCAQKIGVDNLCELDMFMELASVLGKYVDQAYVKQVELADLQGGQAATAHKGTAGEDGARHIYDLPADGSVELKTYSEVFPFEWQWLTKNFIRMSVKVDQLIQSGQLAQEKYAGLSAYLQKLADTYGSAEKNLHKIPELWKELLEASKELALAGCPIVLVPQDTAAVAGDADKVDVELRLGFRTEHMREQEKQMGAYHTEAEKLLHASQPFLEPDKHYAIPPAIINYQPYAFGPNLYWMTRAEASERSIVVHANAIEEVAEFKALPLLKKMFDEQVDGEAFGAATLRGTIRHEMGHTIIPRRDQEVQKRIGSGSDASILEELKADVFDMRLLRERVGHDEQIDVRTEFLAKLGDILDYLAHKSPVPGTSGERYYFSGVAMLGKLLDSKVIEKKDGHYIVVDVNSAVKAISEMSEEIFALYLKKSPNDFSIYVRRLRERALAEDISQFVAEVKK